MEPVGSVFPEDINPAATPDCLIGEKEEKRVFVKTTQNKTRKRSCSNCTAPCLSPLTLQEHVLFSPSVVMTLDGDVGWGRGSRQDCPQHLGKASCPGSALGMAPASPGVQREKGWRALESEVSDNHQFSWSRGSYGHQGSCWVSFRPLQCKLALI